MSNSRSLVNVNVGFKIFEGSGHPFGATVRENGVNFSVYSQNATSVELLIFTVLSASFIL